MSYNFSSGSIGHVEFLPQMVILELSRLNFRIYSGSGEATLSGSQLAVLDGADGEIEVP